MAQLKREEDDPPNVWFSPPGLNNTAGLRMTAGAGVENDVVVLTTGVVNDVVGVAVPVKFVVGVLEKFATNTRCTAAADALRVTKNVFSSRLREVC